MIVYDWGCFIKTGISFTNLFSHRDLVDLEISDLKIDGAIKFSIRARRERRRSITPNR